MSQCDPDSKKTTISLKEAIEIAGAIVRWGSLSMGGLCLLMYTHEIGQFPEGLNLGEGLAFYLVCVGFWIVYSVYVVGLTTAGTLLIGIAIKLGTKLKRKKAEGRVERHRNVDAPTDFSSMWDVPVAALGCTGWFFLGTYLFQNPGSAWVAVVISLFQGMAVAMVVWLRRQRGHALSGLVVTLTAPSDPKRKAEGLLFAQRVLAAFIFVFPLIVSLERTALVDAAFKIAKLRKDDAIIHVRKPWSIRISQSTLQSSPSFLGE